MAEHWGRQRPFGETEKRFVSKGRKEGRHEVWLAYDVMTASFPGAIPGFGMVRAQDTEEQCKVLCAQLAEFHAGKPGVGR